MRHTDWSQRLAKVIEKANSEEFAYGVWDCGAFASDCLNAVGIDFIDPYILHMQGKYKTMLGSLRAVKKAGYDSIGAMMRDYFPKCGPSHAWRGDLAIHEENLGVCMGSVVFFLGEEGIEKISRAEVKEFYKVR